MKTKLKSAMIAIPLALGLINSASAANLRVPTIDVNRNDYTGSLGYKFTSTTSNTVINSLGFVDANSDGLNTSHLVSLFEVSSGNTYNLLASVTVGAGTSGFLDGGYRWATIPSITLSNTAGSAYIVMAQVVSGDGDNWGDTAGFDSSIGSLGANSLVSPTSLGNPHDFSSQINNAPPSYNPGNISTLIIPEPATSLLGAFGMLALLRRRRA
jgi:hypothetical protein